MKQVVQSCHGTHKISGFVVEILHLHAFNRRKNPSTVLVYLTSCKSLCVSQHMYVLQVNKAKSDMMDKNMALVVKNHIQFVV